MLASSPIRRRRCAGVAGPRSVLDADHAVDEFGVAGVGDDELTGRVFDVASEFGAAPGGVDPDDARPRQRRPEHLERVLRQVGHQQPDVRWPLRIERRAQPRRAGGGFGHDFAPRP